MGMGSTSWVRSITSPFRNSCIFLHHHHHHHHNDDEEQRQQQQQQQQRVKKSSNPGIENRVMNLQSEVMACAYEDVQVMWSMLDKSKPGPCDDSS